MPALGAFHINGFIFEHPTFSGAGFALSVGYPSSYVTAMRARWTRKTRARRNSLCRCLHHL